MKRKNRWVEFWAAFLFSVVVLSIVAAFFGASTWLLIHVACALGLPRFAAPAGVALVAAVLALATVGGGEDHDAP